MTTSKQTIGIVGLGVMGLSLARNMRSKGYYVLGYDAQEKMRIRAEEHEISTTNSLQSFVKGIATPRRILIMVPAGDPVDAVLHELTPLLDKGDSIVDGGNSFFKETRRRERELESQGIHFLGLGVSGGRRGALEGPGLMAGGSKAAYAQWQEVLESIAARFDDKPCVAYLGKGGAGHYVKMVHNGIEYGMMQALAEAYAILKIDGDRSNEELAEIFNAWDKGEPGGYLTAITSRIFEKSDPKGTFWIEEISDVASQKGTGNWTVQNALELGVPIPGIYSAVCERQISSYHEARQQLGGSHKSERLQPNIKTFLSEKRIGDALHAVQVLIFIQGFHLLRSAMETYNFSYQLTEVARIWQNGCIISGRIVESFATMELDDSEHLLLIREYADIVSSKIEALKACTALSTTNLISLPCLSANLNYWLSFSNSKLPTNLIQAQRDYFGGHGLELKSGKKTSLDWEGSTN